MREEHARSDGAVEPSGSRPKQLKAPITATNNTISSLGIVPRHIGAESPTRPPVTEMKKSDRTASRLNKPTVANREITTECTNPNAKAIAKVPPPHANGEISKEQGWEPAMERTTPVATPINIVIDPLTCATTVSTEAAARTPSSGHRRRAIRRSVQSELH